MCLREASITVVLLFTSGALFFVVSSDGGTPTINHGLLQRTEAGDAINILVTMRQGTGAILTNIATKSFKNVGDQRTALFLALQEHAAASQNDLLLALPSSLASQSSLVTSYWITNQVYIQDAGLSTLQFLLRQRDVSSIEEDGIVRLSPLNPHVPESDPAPMESTATNASANWNINSIRAPELWELGINGTGILIGSISAGVRHEHEILRSSFKNDSYSWFDSLGNTTVPSDEYRFGTINMGVMTGGDGFGVAPGAKWIACKAFGPDYVGTPSSIIGCAQFMMCPTWSDGTQPDCTHAPHIVHNPWYEQQRAGYMAFLDAWHVAGIIPVFGAGTDDHTVCVNPDFPAMLDSVIAVGAIDVQGRLADLSGRGPGAYGNVIKPDISAPGMNVNSSNKDSDNSYALMCGISQSSAHVAGVIALLLSVDSSLGQDELKRILFASSHHQLEFTCEECVGRMDAVFPNYHFGYGGVDAYSAYKCLKEGRSCLDAFDEQAATGITADFSHLCSETFTNNTHWIIAGLSLAGVLIVSLIALLVWRWRIRKDEDIILQAIQQFRNGDWPMHAGKGQDGSEVETDETGEMMGNAIAMETRYDLERYEIPGDSLTINETEVLGSGEFGIVFGGRLKPISLEKNRDAELEVAVKKLKLTTRPECVNSFLKELKIMIYVGQHQNVLYLLGACTSDIDSLCIVTEYCSNGSLKKYLRAHRTMFRSGAVAPTEDRKYVHVQSIGPYSGFNIMPLTPVDARDLLRFTTEIATGMEFLSRKKVIHGDLACRNVLLDQNRVVKISDFGLASRLYEYATYVRTEQRLLPWRWMAPESLQDMRFSPASDVWSFGITAWEVYTLCQVPYPGAVWGEAFVKQLVAGLRNSSPTHANEEIYNLMAACWGLKECERPTMAELAENLCNLKIN